MHRPALLLLLLPLSPACQRIDADEAALVLSATWEISRDVQEEALGLVQEAVSGKSLVVSADAEGEGYLVQGTVAGGPGWQGEADVDGTATYGDGTYQLDLGLALVGVYVGAPDVGLEGPMELALTHEGEVGGTTGAYTLRYDVGGTLAVEGSARGRAELAYSVVLDSDGQDTTFAVEGTIGGHTLTSLGAAE